MATFAGAIVGRMKRLDHQVGRLLGLRRVLVEARTPMNLAVLRPVWEALGHDRRVCVRFTSEDPARVRPPLETSGAGDRWIPRARATWERFDLYVNADPWNATALRRCARRVNFFHGVAGKYDLDAPDRLQAAGFSEYDRIAFVNEDRRDRYLATGAATERQAALVGFPKADALVDGRHDGAAVRRALGLAPGRPVVLYAPTFSPASSLNLHGDALVRCLLEGGYAVIVKLHDRSLDPDARYSGGHDWRARLQGIGPADRFAFADGSDATPYLVAADALVTDHSSIGFEYLLLDRPLVIIDAPALLEAARINPDKWRLLRSAADVAFTLDDLVPAVRRALAAPDRKRELRRHIGSCLFWKPGTATQRALALVYELLELPQCVPSPAPESDIVRGTAA